MRRRAEDILRLPALRAFLAIAGLGAGPAACGSVDGSGWVQIELPSGRCHPERPRPELSRYRFETHYMGTERFEDILFVQLMKDQVALEETDEMILRLHLGELRRSGVLEERSGLLVRRDSSSPIVLRAGTAESDTNVAVSLFQTCPELPTFVAISGQVSLWRITLAVEPEDTGVNESLAGTVTATLARAGSTEPIGTARAQFEFAPPRRPLTDHR